MLIGSVSNKVLLMTAAMAILLAAGCSPAIYNRQHQAPTKARLTSDHPWLLMDLNSWQQEVELTGQQWPGYW